MEVVLPRLHEGQKVVHRDKARFKVLACGRRWGKTRLGNVLCVECALAGGRAWWVAPSYKMGQVGWRGLQRLAWQIPGSDIRLGDQLITFPGGGTVQVRSADDPQSLRGEGLDLAVLDECAYMKEEAWHEALRPALSDRLGDAFFISTPRGVNWFRDLWLRGQDDREYPDWRSWQFRTADNPFIARDEIENARKGMLHRLFRQEFGADFLDDNPNALWRREWFDDRRVARHPTLTRIVVGVDPPGGATECGIVVAGKAMWKGEWHVYVLDDHSLRGRAHVWASEVVTAYHSHEADRIVGETNYGGDMVENTIRTVEDGQDVAYKSVHASRGKQIRAEPISALYEDGRVHHVGIFPQLEEELVNWSPESDKSPNRMDALVWAITELAVIQPERRRTARARAGG